MRSKGDSRLGVALVHKICPVCGRPMDEQIIMNRRLTKPQAQKIESLHGKAVGYADKVCEECAKHKNEVVYFVAIDTAKSDKNNPYRTGPIAGVRKDSEFLKNIDEKFIVTLADHTQLVYIEESAGRAIGFWK